MSDEYSPMISACSDAYRSCYRDHCVLRAVPYSKHNRTHPLVPESSGQPAVATNKPVAKPHVLHRWLAVAEQRRARRWMPTIRRHQGSRSERRLPLTGQSGRN